MATWIAWPIAIVSTAVCLFLWFRDVKRIMRERMNTVQSAAAQLEVCRKKAEQVGEQNPEANVVLKRSESIYQQAVALYHLHLRKPWIWLPATLMGFRKITK